MANRYFKDHVKTLEGGAIKLFGKVVTSTGGTIASQACKGFSVAKTGSEVGRYTVTLDDNFTSLLGISVMVQGAADAAYTATNGLCQFIRNESVSSGTLDIQFADPATSADAELEDAAEFYVEITLKNTSAY